MQLSGAIGVPWVPEYARTYLENLGRSYAFEDLLLMAQGQMEALETSLRPRSDLPPLTSGSPDDPEIHALAVELKRMASDHSTLLIEDSGLFSIRMWAEIKYGRAIEAVDRWLEHDRTSLYLLTRPKRAWEPDPLREAPTLLERAWIYNRYLEILLQGNVPIRIV